MRCPYCGADESKVIDSRPTEDGEKIRRRRECLSCKKRFTTYEIVETVPLMVIKKDRSREVFDRQKLLNGMLRACEKRPVSYEQLDAAVSRIEQVLLNSYDREVTSVYIGDLAMEQLKKMDDVAYVRFASVYRQFSDVNTFMDELKDMLDSRAKNGGMQGENVPVKHCSSWSICASTRAASTARSAWFSGLAYCGKTAMVSFMRSSALRRTSSPSFLLACLALCAACRKACCACGYCCVSVCA